MRSDCDCAEIVFFILAMARMFHAVGSKVILASRNLQQLSQLKFQLDNEPGVLKVRGEWHKGFSRFNMQPKYTWFHFRG